MPSPRSTTPAAWPCGPTRSGTSPSPSRCWPRLPAFTRSGPSPYLTCKRSSGLSPPERRGQALGQRIERQLLADVHGQAPPRVLHQLQRAAQHGGVAIAGVGGELSETIGAMDEL